MNSTTLPKELLIMGRKKLLREEFEEVENIEHHIKPYGGIWASPYTPKEEYVSAWHEWCEDKMDYMVETDSVIFTLRSETRIFFINNQSDLKTLIKIVGGIEYKYMIPYKEEKSISINFEEAKKHYDVIYLTQNGVRTTQEPSKDKEYNLDGGDCESCLILNYDCIETWRYKELDI